jgi:hypothetical protein
LRVLDLIQEIIWTQRNDDDDDDDDAGKQRELEEH